jgi:hypothetical protein
MAYSELIKRFEPIRDYMRQFYLYGFRSRTEYTGKSPRSYDNERRRIESWLGDCMRFRQTEGGKNVFLSVDSRTVPENPIYNAFKAKSFTAGDVTFHFYVLDILQPGVSCTAQELLERICDDYLCHFDAPWQPDISTVRKKLREYVALGLLQAQKQGRELYYSRSESSVHLSRWADAIAFYAEADPMGIVGSTLLDKLPAKPNRFQFKHHYLLHAIDSQILLQLLSAIGSHRHVALQNLSNRRGKCLEHRVMPLKIYISTQNGRQYLLCHHDRFHGMQFFRLDRIQAVTLLEEEPAFDVYANYNAKFRTHLWGTSDGGGHNADHLELTLRYADNEPYIPQRLEREKRNGRVEYPAPNLCKYVVNTYDAYELMPWLRTFIGRVVKLECTDRQVTEQFYADLEAMKQLYGGDNDAVF